MEGCFEEVLWTKLGVMLTNSYFHWPHPNARESRKYGYEEGRNLANSFCHMEIFSSHELVPTGVVGRLSR